MSKLKGAVKSKTINWGHIQVIAGAIATALGFFNPSTFPNLPVWVYGVSAMGAGVITYILRAVTTKPLEEK